jgi:hypothetical protein
MVLFEYPLVLTTSKYPFEEHFIMKNMKDDIITPVKTRSAKMVKNSVEEIFKDALVKRGFELIQSLS